MKKNIEYIHDLGLNLKEHPDYGWVLKSDNGSTIVPPQRADTTDDLVRQVITPVRVFHAAMLSFLRQRAEALGWEPVTYKASDDGMFGPFYWTIWRFVDRDGAFHEPDVFCDQHNDEDRLYFLMADEITQQFDLLDNGEGKGDQ